ncbi:hypothetical protein [Treponema pedis]|uniref:hypothetical protein n=1 Tax=Treponema pedis TaxID=409322 RepID=UPI003D1A059B
MFGKRSGAVYTEKAYRLRELTLGKMHPPLQSRKVFKTDRGTMPVYGLKQWRADKLTASYP